LLCKSLFLHNKGFASHSHILSGDDDLFINEVANGKNTRVEFSSEAHTRSIPKKVFNLWTFQKKRHLSSGKNYKLKHKLLLGLEITSRILFYAGLFMTLINLVIWMVGIAAFIFRMIIQLLIFNKAMDKLNEKKLLPYSIVFDFVLPLTILFLYFANFFNSKQHRWN